jgi:hypothetical protein
MFTFSYSPSHESPNESRNRRTTSPPPGSLGISIGKLSPKLPIKTISCQSPDMFQIPCLKSKCLKCKSQPWEVKMGPYSDKVNPGQQKWIPGMRNHTLGPGIVFGPEFLSRIRLDNSCEYDVKDFTLKFAKVKKHDNPVRVIECGDSRTGFTRILGDRQECHSTFFRLTWPVS